MAGKTNVWIRLSRKRLALRQADLAEQLGISQASVSQLETGKREPTPQEMKALRKLFGATDDAKTELPPRTSKSPSSGEQPAASIAKVKRTIPSPHSGAAGDTAPGPCRGLLTSIGLGQYAKAFEDHHIDLAMLAKLTSKDLIELGVASLGHRKTIMEAARKGGTAAGAAPASVAPSLLPAAAAELPVVPASRAQDESHHAACHGAAGQRLAAVMRDLMPEFTTTSRYIGVVKLAIEQVLRGNYDAALAKFDNAITVDSRPAAAWVGKFILEPWSRSSPPIRDLTSSIENTLKRVAARVDGHITHSGGVPIRAVIIEMNLEIAAAQIASYLHDASTIARRAQQLMNEANRQSNAAAATLAASRRSKSSGRKTAGYAATGVMTAAVLRKKQQSRELQSQADVVQNAADQMTASSIPIAKELLMSICDRKDASDWAADWVAMIKRRLCHSATRSDERGLFRALEMPDELVKAVDVYFREAALRKRPYYWAAGIMAIIATVCLFILIDRVPYGVITGLLFTTLIASGLGSIIAMVMAPEPKPHESPLVQALNAGTVDLFTYFTSVPRPS